MMPNVVFQQILLSSPASFVLVLVLLFIFFFDVRYMILIKVLLQNQP